MTGYNVSNGTVLRTIRAGEKSKGVNYTTLACHASVLTPHVRDHLSRAARKIEELYNQLPSPVTPDVAQRSHWESQREAYVARICEVIEHVGATLTAMGCTDTEMEKLLGCEDGANETEIEISTAPSESSEEHTPMEKSGSDKTVTVPLPVEGLKKVPNNGN